VPNANAETLRRVYADFARGEFAASLGLFDPYVVFIQRDESNILGRDVSGVYWGIDGLRDYMLKLFEPWARVTIELRDLVEAGDSVVAEVVMRVVGRGGGVPAEVPYFQVWSLPRRQGRAA
jgi:ketosteroid isomerase-like protein